MRTLLHFLATAGCLLTAAGAFGQQNLNPIGQGNILHPGIPSSGPPRFHQRPGGGPDSFHGHGYGYGNGYGNGQIMYIPYGVPIDSFYSGYTGGYGGVFNPEPGAYDPIFGGYNPGPYAQAPQQQQQQTPTVIVNQNFQPDAVRPAMYDFTNRPPPNVVQLDRPQPRNGAQQAATPPDDRPTIFLIAMKDHTIYPVIAYWVDKDTLNYVTVESAVKRVPLDQVDRDLSRQLNDERNVEFRLPAR